MAYTIENEEKRRHSKMLLINPVGERSQYTTYDIKLLFDIDELKEYNIFIKDKRIELKQKGKKYPANYIILNPTKETIIYLTKHRR